MKNDWAAKKAAVKKRKEFISLKRDRARLKAEGVNSDPVVLAPAPILPPSFDSSNATLHRYRYSENQAGWIVRPRPADPNFIVDHDDGIVSVNVVRSLMARAMGKCVGGLPLYLRAEIPKDNSSNVFQGEASFTTGLDLLPIFGHKLETTKLTTSFAVNASDSSFSDTLFILRCESLSKNLPRINNKILFGLQISRIPEGILRFNGSSTYGAKIENRVKLTREYKASISLGVLFAPTPGGGNQSLKSIIGEIKKKIEKHTSLRVQGSLKLSRRLRDTTFMIEHQKNLSPKTTLNTRISCENLREGSVRLRVLSLDHPELALSLLVPLVAVLMTKKIEDDEF
jgi:hypothetical protein